jgi:hypothetical protein
MCSICSHPSSREECSVCRQASVGVARPYVFDVPMTRLLTAPALSMPAYPAMFNQPPTLHAAPAGSPMVVVVTLTAVRRAAAQIASALMLAVGVLRGCCAVSTSKLLHLNHLPAILMETTDLIVLLALTRPLALKALVRLRTLLLLLRPTAIIASVLVLELLLGLMLLKPRLLTRVLALSPPDLRWAPLLAGCALECLCKCVSLSSGSA